MAGNFGTGSGQLIAPDQTTERNLVVVLLDASGSMDRRQPSGVRRIDELNQAVRNFITSGISEVPQLHINGELAIGAFSNGRVDWLQLGGDAVEPGSAFQFARSCTSAPTLEPSGGTPMGMAVEQGLDLIEERKMQLRSNGIVHEFRPNIFLLTDGHPSDDIFNAIQRVKAADDKKAALFWGLGTEDAAAETLIQLAGPGAFLVRDAPLEMFIEFLSRSMRSMGGLNVDEMTGDEIKNEIAAGIAEEKRFDDAFEQLGS